MVSEPIVCICAMQKRKLKLPSFLPAVSALDRDSQPFYFGFRYEMQKSTEREQKWTRPRPLWRLDPPSHIASCFEGAAFGLWFIGKLADAGISSVPVLSIRCFTDLNRKDTYDQQTNAREGARRIYRATPLGFIIAAKEKVSEPFGEPLNDE